MKIKGKPNFQSRNVERFSMHEGSFATVIATQSSVPNRSIGYSMIRRPRPQESLKHAPIIKWVSEVLCLFSHCFIRQYLVHFSSSAIVLDLVALL